LTWFDRANRSPKGAGFACLRDPAVTFPNQKSQIANQKCLHVVCSDPACPDRPPHRNRGSIIRYDAPNFHKEIPIFEQIKTPCLSKARQG
jgi:hypothetical protein